MASQGFKTTRADASLLPTPAVFDMGANRTVEAWDEWTDKLKGNGYNGNGHGASLAIEALRLLPTPLSRDHKETSAPHERDGVIQTDNLPRAIFHSGEVELLGTPRVSSKGGSSKKQVEAGAPKSRLEDQVEASRQGVVSWGRFEPAIRRWEAILGRPAPSPTLPDGKDGAHRLSPLFTEFMMGIPVGWVTDAGLTRAEALKACGNGVVPQQAARALRILLGSMQHDSSGGGSPRMPMLPTPTVSDNYTDNLDSSQMKEGLMHSVTLPRAVRLLGEGKL